MPSKIPYCDETWEVTGGCTKTAQGCQNCWAIRDIWRLAHNPKLGDKWQGLVEKKNGIFNWTGKIKCFEDALEKPLKRKKPTTYFVDSKADLFHPKVPFGYIYNVYFQAYQAERHTYQILTKRIERAKEFYHWMKNRCMKHTINRPNVHLGVSISTQAEADEKIPILLQIPAAVRWLSIEPMLGPVELRCIIGDPRRRCIYDCLRGTAATEAGVIEDKVCGSIDWVVVGCESGPGHRPCKLEWVRDIIQQCKAAGVPVFVKQIEINGKVERNMKKFPKDLQIQEYPK